MQETLYTKVRGAIGATVVVGLIGYAFVVGMTVDMGKRIEQAMALVDIPMRQPPPKPPQPIVRPKPNRAPNPASPRNLRNKAAEIEKPPLVLPPLPSPVIAAPKPGLGMASSAGASDRPGTGQGAGGDGDGTGGGGDVPPRQIKGRLKFSDLPASLREAGISGTVSVHYTVDVAGGVEGCTVTGSSGNGELDRATCLLIDQRFRFKPSRDGTGRPVSSTIEERHIWEVDQPADAGR